MIQKGEANRLAAPGTISNALQRLARTRDALDGHTSASSDAILVGQSNTIMEKFLENRNR